MDLLERTLAEMGENNPLVKKHNLRVRVLGRLELLEDSVLRAVAKTMNATKDNRGKIVNICVAYAGRDEIASAIRETVADPGVPSKITATSLTENMFMGVPPLDLLVRTSGVYRLSDFMLWQCHQGADIEVVGMNWPDFGRWDICMILLRWQSRRRASAYV
jgi:ditrans,polycis-polyprenyl diphosphate synthase